MFPRNAIVWWTISWLDRWENGVIVRNRWWDVCVQKDRLPSCSFISFRIHGQYFLFLDFPMILFNVTLILTIVQGNLIVAIFWSFWTVYIEDWSRCCYDICKDKFLILKLAVKIFNKNRLARIQYGQSEESFARSVQIWGSEQWKRRRNEYKLELRARKFFIALLRRICLALGRQTILLRDDQDQPPRPSTYLQCKQIKESSTVPVYDHRHLQYMQWIFYDVATNKQANAFCHYELLRRCRSIFIKKERKKRRQILENVL